MRNAFINELSLFAKDDKDIIMMVGDLGYGVLKPFYEELPNQFINAGISEQNMLSMAAALGMEHKKVYTYSIGNFDSLRAIEQIRNDILYHDANVKIISVGSGMGYGALGMSHHATEDLGIMNCLPNIIIFSPSDPIEAKKIAELTVKTNKPCYIRLGKGNEPIINSEKVKLEIGKAIKIVDGKDVAIFVAGPGASEAYEAAKELIEQNISTALYSFPTVKPIDEKLIKKVFKDYKLVITFEEHNIHGGLGSIVAFVAAGQRNNRAVLKCIGLNDEYVSTVGSQEYLRDVYNINAKAIIDVVKKELGD